MSEEAVEFMRGRYEALNRALATGADLSPLMDGVDPEIVVEMGVLEGTFHGREGLRRFIEGQVALFEDLRCDPKEFIDAGDQIVVPMCLTGRRGTRDFRLSTTQSTCGRCGRARRPVCGSTRVRRRPSKPPGWRSRPRVHSDLMEPRSESLG